MADDLISSSATSGSSSSSCWAAWGCPSPKRRRSSWRASSPAKGRCTGFPRWLSSFAGVLVGDFVVYFLGFFYGEKVLSLPLTRKFLTKARETQIKGYFHRHGSQDPDPRPVRRRVPDGGLPHGGHPPPADPQAVPDRPLRRVDQHPADVLAGLRLRQPGRGGLKRGQALHHPGDRPGRRGLAAPPLRQGQAPTPGSGSGRRSWSPATTPRCPPTTSMPSIRARRLPICPIPEPDRRGSLEDPRSDRPPGCGDPPRPPDDRRPLSPVH